MLKQTLQSFAIGLLSIFGSTAASAQYIIHVAGTHNPGHGGDTSEAYFASLRCPSSVCLDAAGNLYVGDGGPYGYINDACIRKINKATGIITSITAPVDSPFAATDTLDRILAKDARLTGVAGICIDSRQNMYIADGKGWVRKINMTNDTISTVAGNRHATGYSGDGGLATAALLDGARDVAVDAAGNVYIADMNNHVVRKVTVASGTISTVAGIGSMGFSGDGGPAISARLNHPRGLYIDADNNLYIADYYNNRIRMVSGSTIRTIAGNGPGFDGDGGPATAALLAQPARITMDASKNIYIADVANQRIRKIDNASKNISTFAGTGAYFSGPDTLGDKRLAKNAAIVPYGMCFDACNNLFLGGVLYSVRVITPALPGGGALTCSGFRVNDVADIADVNPVELNVFPNPNDGTFTVSLVAARTEPVDVVITDITGRKIDHVTTVTNKNTELQVTTPGMYFVQVITANGTSSKKIVVQ